MLFMSGIFTKAVLNVGTYESPDGVVEVTPERLKHWAQQVSRMQDTGYAIPMHWDHASDTDLLEPIRMDVLRKNESRSAKNTVGKLISFDVQPDGQSAELTVETLTADATEKASSNAVFVSPVIFDKWKDGAGNQYTDTIGSVDLVDHPVDYKQGPFKPVVKCAIRMSAKPTKIYKLSEVTPVDQEDKASDVQDESGATSSTSIKDVLDALAALKIILPEDTTDANFLERLRPALLTAAAQDKEPDGDEDPNKQAENSSIAQDPMIATMSAQARNAFNYATNQHRTTVSARLQKLLEDGRCSPAEHSKMKGSVSTIKLSLNAQGQPIPSQVESWIESREAVPKGTFWSAEQRTQKMSLHENEAPEEWEVSSKSKISQSEEDAAVKALMRRR